MKAYLVGGAVRDQLLNYPIKERDWVVIGSTPEALLAQGFKQVGKDFPVFLHPQTKEEYALARTEKKKGHGYHGFTCEFHPDVRLEQDLARRDLTINAMAQDEQGEIIDPFGGIKDLQARLLRHVSDAFVEDPVRVLRIARFAARYHHLGFRVAEETQSKIYQMVRDGELDHLVPERVWQEWAGALNEKNPEVFILTLRLTGALKSLFPEIEALFGVPNPPQYHSEIDSGIHALKTLETCCQLTMAPKARFAALVHDLGKALTPMSLWPKHHGHEKKSVEIITSLAKRLRIPSDYRKLACLVARYHLNIHRFSELRASTIVTLLENINAFKHPESFQQLLIVCQADAQSKSDKPYEPIIHWQRVRDLCMQIKVEPIIQKGHQGAMIKSVLHQQRVEAVKHYLDTL